MRDAVFVIVVAGAGARTALAQDMGTVRVEIAGLQGATGNIYIAVYDSGDNWLGRTLSCGGRSLSPMPSRVNWCCRAATARGQLRLSVFYDVNNNGELDTNFIGIPKSRWLFQQAGLRAARKYKDAVFTRRRAGSPAHRDRSI